ncbi:MAG TPA: histidine kinase [Burkholderiaceae bacterium]|nr:histidine kinase [Burkholderiaceae bacterium]
MRLPPRFADELQLAFRRYFRLRKVRDESLLARLLVTCCFALAFPTGIMAVTQVFGARPLDLTSVLGSYACGFLIAFLIHGAYRLSEVLLPQSALDRLNAGGWRAGLFFSLLPILCIAAGLLLFGQLLGWWMQVRVETPFDSRQGLSRFLFLSLLFALVGWFLDHQRRRRQALQLQATEAQLLRLQAQIEPHFLFNSLAAVQSLIKPAPDRALEMLEHFTDYLRASLSALREDSCSLSTELQVARSYLGLMQIRMGERLSFSVEATPEAEAQRLPPLLLQPLVENAIVHGLEPKDEGGTVQLRAWVDGPLLHVVVQDSGLGSQAARRRARPGHGLALRNIRERLQARHGERAELLLHLSEDGCTAELRLPLASARTDE